jgi:hypothetical protein
VYIQTTKDYFEEAPRYMPILHYELIGNQYTPVSALGKNKTYYVKIRNKFYPIYWIYQSSKKDNNNERKNWKAITTNSLTIKSDNNYAYAIKIGKEQYQELDKQVFEIPEYYQIQYEEHQDLEKITNNQSYYYMIKDKYYPL